MPFPVPKFHFNVVFPLGGPVSFQEVTGLDQESDSLEYRAGDDPDYVTHKRAGLLKTSTVSFKKGIFKDDTTVLDEWKPMILDQGGHSDYFSDSADPGDIVVTLLDETAAPICSWTIKGAVPVKLSNGDLKSDDNNIAIEQIDFVHRGIELNLPA